MSRFKAMPVAFFVLFFTNVSAQLPKCGMLYYEDWPSYFNQFNHHIINYDPAKPLSLTNPDTNSIPFPSNANELAVSENLNGGGPSPTFYTTIGDYYYYFNDTGWVNTGHLAKALNTYGGFVKTGIGAGGQYIYSVYEFTNPSVSFDSLKVFRYDGSGNASLILASGAQVGIDYVYGDFGILGGDIAADCQDNFYLFHWSLIEKFDANGNLLQTWQPVGPFPGGATTNSSLALIGDTIFTSEWHGVLNAFSNTVGVIPNNVSISGEHPFDMASCAGAPAIGTMQANIDTGFYCGIGAGLLVNVVGSGLPTSTAWSVLNGPASIAGTGPAVTVSASANSQISLNAVCYNPDTVTIIVPHPEVNAGTDHTVTGCSPLYLDTLHGVVADSCELVAYSYSWSPSALIKSGVESLDPVATPVANIEFVLNVSTPLSQGGCIWQDTVKLTLVDSSAKPDFSYFVNYSCTYGDTIYFQNLSADASNYIWDFADGSTDTVANPEHVFHNKENHFVRLIGANSICTDTIIKPVENLDLQVVPFYLGDDIRICRGTPVDLVIDAKPVPGADVLWSDCSTRPAINIRDTGTYWVMASKYPCSFVDTIRIISELCDCIVSIPSAFTPNGDGHNDRFRAITEQSCLVEGYLLQIYNRWGQLIYIGNSCEIGWDGTFNGQPADIGTYMYTLQLETGTENRRHYFQGDLILIR